MVRLLLLFFCFSLLLPDAEAASDALLQPPGAESVLGVAQLIRRPHGGNYKRRRTLRKASRKAKKNDKRIAARNGVKYEKKKSLKARKREERRAAKHRKGVITVDRPIRNN
ncbi:hypothetical protein EJV47_16310 [Hymenobacter gummosus]|uniref:Secreted protein n=1 Tax=Hymenobacter gummosus TaxID=1776032 RepID=A0A431U0V7_9BACT|nr:hypothetical protein [Hymenobacter gummosus]RTQ48534.1 hypothetical protein EJV47_16310 [Hymenobacter gummosus]